MDNPPIGILSRNRAAYLDVTLRSLSATTLPSDVSVRVFDDASDDAATLRYYKTTGRVGLTYRWPVDKKWAARGFTVLPTDGISPCRGIADKVVISQSVAACGVVAASCDAVQQLFSDTTADGVFLLQDDVLFNVDWYSRMLDTVARSREFTDKPVGLLAGIKLNTPLHVNGLIAIPSGITAQCLYISRQAFDSVPFLTRPPNVKQRFDDLLRKSVTQAGMWGGVIYPFVCQHIGVKSLVRPHKRWAVGSAVRVGLYSIPPYAMSDEVRQWK